MTGFSGSGGFGSSGGDPTLAGVDDGEATLGPDSSSPGGSATHGGSGGYAIDDAPPQPGSRIGHFVVQRVLGAGAMGLVMLAIDPELDRPVAIKLLAPHYGNGDVARQRLIREAQAVGRLSHPNVVSVHQVGTHGERVYMVMEYVDGGTLGQWVKAQPRTVAEIVGAYRQAAQGLAAAHAAGLVHRDFKPDNALIGTDGRVRVSDFGLVTPTGTEAPSGPTGTIHAEADARLTQTGVLLGTPAYMAPEQFAGLPVDARADQFALCVALFEALYGVRPYAGDNVAQLYASISTGRLAAARRDDVPASLQGAISRGLSAEPDARHASMHALVAALQVPVVGRAAKPPVVAAVAGLVAVLALGGGAAAWALTRSDDDAEPEVRAAAAPVDAGTDVDPGDLCAPPREDWEGGWDGTRREALRNALAGTGYAAASTAADRIVARADEYLAASEAARHEACRARARADHASEREGDAPPDEAKQAMCFELGADALSGLVDGLVDAPTVERMHVALDLLDALPPVPVCTDAEAIAAFPAVPDDAQQPVVRDVRRKLWRTVLAMQATEYDAAKKLVRQARLSADEAGYLPLDAEVQTLDGTLLMLQGERTEAEVVMRTALETAKRAEYAAAEADAAVGLVRAVGADPARIAEALQLVGPAKEAIERARAQHVMWALDTTAAGLYEMTGRFLDAESAYSHALASLDALDPIPLTDKAYVLSRRGAVLRQLLRTDEAVADYEASLQTYTEALGQVHPLRVGTLVGYATLLMQLGRFMDARAQMEDAAHVLDLAGRDLGFGVEVYWTRSFIEENLGDFAAAVRAGQQAVQHHEVQPSRTVPEWMLRQRLGYLLANDDKGADADRQLEMAVGLMDPETQPVEVAEVVALRGRAAFVQGKYPEAQERFAAAVRLRERGLGTFHNYVASAYVALGDMQMLQDRCEEATDSYETALNIRSKIGALPDVDLVKIHLGEADCALAQGRADEGSTALDNAEALLTHHALGDDLKARATAVRARLRWAEGEHEAALAEAATARDAFDDLGTPYRREKQLVVDWIAAHPAPP